MKENLKQLFPLHTSINKQGCLVIGGCNTTDLVKQFGTPLYVYDEDTIVFMCKEFKKGFQNIKGVKIFYASKAYTTSALIKILVQEGLGVDVVSSGEIFIALKGEMNPENIAFHGNGKEEHELEYAVDVGVGRVIVDNMDELLLLSKIAKKKQKHQKILLRITPDVDPKTHHKTTTGTVNSKFGFSLKGGQAEEGVKIALQQEYIKLMGLHTHLGSPIYTLDPYKKGVMFLCQFASEMKEKYQYEWSEFSPGGGFAIGYTKDNLPLGAKEYGECIGEVLQQECARHNLTAPEVHIEPGRSIVGRAGVALYNVVSRNIIPNIRSYITVNGGMADNPRVAMYDAKYEVVVANKMNEKPTGTFTIAGKYCESGDVLVRNAHLPSVGVGDIIAMPSAGAYHLSMESNYNMALRPAVVFIKNGKARLVRPRQKVDELY